MKSLSLKVLVLAVGLVATSLSTSASAKTYAATYDSSIFTYSFTDSFSGSKTFTDVVTGFNLPARDYNGSVHGYVTNLSKTFIFTKFDLYDSLNNLVSVGTISLNGNNADANIQGLLTAGLYSLHISGKTTGAGLYSGNLSVSAVPEPETYGMMLAGLGLMGFVARRRKSV